MRDYSKVSTSIWNSRKFTKLSGNGKLLYLYFLTCPFVNSVGCFVIKELYALADLDWQPKTYKKALEEISSFDLVKLEPLENLVRIVNFLEFEQFSNPKHAAGSLKIALNLPDCAEKYHLLKNIIETGKFLEKASNYSELESAIDTLYEAYGNPDTEPKPDTDPDTKPSAKAESSAGAAPSKKKRTAWKEGWRPQTLSEKMKNKIQLSQEELSHEFQKFEESCKAHNRTYIDWEAAWRNWLQSDYGTYGKRLAGKGSKNVDRANAAGNKPKSAGLGGAFERELEALQGKGPLESYRDVTPRPDDADETLCLGFDKDA